MKVAKYREFLWKITCRAMSNQRSQLKMKPIYKLYHYYISSSPNTPFTPTPLHLFFSQMQPLSLWHAHHQSTSIALLPFLGTHLFTVSHLHLVCTSIASWLCTLHLLMWVQRRFSLSEFLWSLDCFTAALFLRSGDCSRRTEGWYGLEMCWQIRTGIGIGLVDGKAGLFGRVIVFEIGSFRVNGSHTYS